MKLSSILALILFGALAHLAAAQDSDTFLIEGEDFQFIADWERDVQKTGRVLKSADGKCMPLTVFQTRAGGEFYVWTLSPDYPDNKPGTRRYQVFIDGNVMPKEAGQHGRDGFYWEKLGSAELSKGNHALSLKCLTRLARCDAVLFTTDKDLDPNITYPEKLKSKLRRKPVHLDSEYVSGFPQAQVLDKIKGAKAVSVENEFAKIIFTPMRAANGKTYFERSMALKTSAGLKELAAFVKEGLIVQYIEQPKYTDRDYFVKWYAPSSAKIVAKMHEQSFDIAAGRLDPYAVGESQFLKPVDVKPAGEGALKLSYENGAEALLTLAKGAHAAKFDVSYKASKDGFYSLGFLGFDESLRTDLRATMLPCMYQKERIMEFPKLVSNNMMSQPISLVELKCDGLDSFTCGIVADPAKLPFEWSCLGNSRYGFSLASPRAKIQTAVFSPILGGLNSFKKAGEVVSASWYIYASNGDWRDALSDINEEIFAGSTLREAYEVSFTRAIANLAAYLENARASGWSAYHKGRWNIEASYTATQASPLAELELALLTDDEDYYANFALPTIEFTLSRKEVHFSPDMAEGNWFFEGCTKLQAGGPWTADYFAGLNKLLGNANPWLDAFIRDENGKIKARKGGESPDWWILLGVCLAQPSDELLQEAKASCDAWLKKSFDTPSYGEPEMLSFINTALYPYWWYLPAMYEATGDKKYLDYAENGAFYTLSSLWSYPTPPKAEIVINKDNIACAMQSDWWLGRDKWRMGFKENDFALSCAFKDGKIPNRKDLSFETAAVYPQKSVDAMKVSRIGLGIEKHSTYHANDGTNYRNILMPSWSAEMLKVYQYTGRDILMKYSRHAIIGRYSNFLGYYIKDFTDIAHDANYPYAGPDVTSFYFHQAPCQFAQSVDYLMAQLEIASGGKISFPYVRQQGYVWFTDRIFGLAGKVFDEEACRPLLNIDAVSADSVKISILLARGKDFIWVILLNDGGTALTPNIRLNPTAKALKGLNINAPIDVYDGGGQKLSQIAGALSDISINIEPMGLRALKIAAASLEVSASKPLGTADYKVFKDVAKGWGDIHLFRIRGPFSKDSVYAFATGAKGLKKARMVLQFNNGAQISKDEYPFEVSAYPVSQDADIEVCINLFEDGKAVAKPVNAALIK